jgi:hypothetical protein
MGLDELDTFENTISKHVITDSVMTVPLTLSSDELSKIEKKLMDIHYFDYPDTFFAHRRDALSLSWVDPHDTYFFRVQVNSRIKSVFWEDSDPFDNFDPRAVDLRKAVKFICQIIESRSEYKKLPPHASYQ